tara:strand:+ start:346 stop:1092 length:747 start_codon:yes stop_codon:yes gene_type:complete
MKQFYHVLNHLLFLFVVVLVNQPILASPYYTYCNTFVIACPQQLPSGLIQTNIGHRFYGPISEGVGSLYGMDSGANVILYTSYTLTHNDKLHVQRLRENKELQLGYQRSQQLQNLPLFLLVQVNAVWFQDNNDSVFNGTSIVGATYDFKVAQLHTNFGFDHYNQSNGYGVAFVYELSEEWDAVMEGFQTNSNNDPSLSIGAIYHTFGHRFKLGIHNSTAMSFQTLILGTARKDWVFGFQIHRLLEIDE